MIYDKVSSILIMLLSILEVYLVLCLIFELFCVFVFCKINGFLHLVIKKTVHFTLYSLIIYFVGSYRR